GRDSDPLQHDRGELVGYAGHRPYREEELPGAPWFREVGRTVVESAEETSPDGIVSHLETTRIFVTMAPTERERRLAEIRAIANRYGDRISLPRKTFVFAYAAL